MINCRNLKYELNRSYKGGGVVYLRKSESSHSSLQYINATSYCSSEDETIKGHMVQTRQGVQYTKPKNQRKQGVKEFPEIDEPTPGNDSENELYVQVVHKHILYTDDTGRFLIRDKNGNQYVMVAYHSSNFILVHPFYSRKDKNGLAAYNSIMYWLKEKYLLVDLHILDNECIK